MCARPRWLKHADRSARFAFDGHCHHFLLLQLSQTGAVQTFACRRRSIAMMCTMPFISL